MNELIERDSELRTLDQELRAGASVLVTGEAGVGKTTLAREVVSHLSGDDRPVVQVYGLESRRDLPLAAFSLALSLELGDRGGIPGLALERALPVGTLPTLLLVDDVDLLDAQSVDALAHVIEHGRAAAVMTQRSSATTPPGLAAAISRGDVAQVQLSTLTPEGTSSLAAECLGSRLTAGSARRVHTLTGGNPLFIRELALAASETGAVSTLRGEVEIGEVPTGHARLQGVIVGRIERLDDDSADALRRIAAIAPASLAELEPHVPPGIAEMLERRGLVVIEADRRRLSIRPAYPIQGEVLAAMTPPLATRRYRADAADRIRELGARRGIDRLRMATWALDGGRNVPAAELAIAAQIAFRAGDHDLAARLAVSAFDAEPTLDHARLADMCLVELSDMDALADHHRKWGVVLDDEYSLAHLDCAMALSKLGRSIEQPQILDICERARDTSLDPAQRDVYAATGSCILSILGETDATLELAVPRSDLPPGTEQLLVTVALGHAYRASGRPMVALQAMESSAALYAQLGEELFGLSENMLAGVRALAVATAGRPAELDACIEQSVATAQQFGTLKDLGVARMTEASGRLLYGEVARAISASQEAGRLFDRARQHGLRRWALGVEVLAEAASGDLSRAKALLDVIDAPGQEAAVVDPAVTRARAWIAIRDGDQGGATDTLLEGAKDAGRVGNVESIVFMACDLARIGAPDVGTELVEGLADRADGFLLPTMVKSIEARASGSAAALEEAAEQFVAIRCLHLAAELYEELAAATAGNGRSVDRSERIRELRAQTDYLPLSELSNVQIAGLTRREAEVARIAARGATSREIGEALFISTRTVETHLARVYNKLGISSRAELIDAHRHGLSP